MVDVITPAARHNPILFVDRWEFTYHHAAAAVAVVVLKRANRQIRFL